MAFAQRARVLNGPIPIGHRAADNLRFIRDTMERAASFTAVPGWGGVVIGITALAAGGLALGRPARQEFFIWVAEAILALSIGFLGSRLEIEAAGAFAKFTRRAPRSVQFCAAAISRSSPHGCSLPHRGAWCASRIVALALRRGSRNGRRFFGANRSGDGSVFHARRVSRFARARSPWGMSS